MNNRRPPLADLRVFEAAARHLSFTRAGVELGVTQGAISQRIRHLEDLLGLRLFERLTRAMVLTSHGRLLAMAVGEGLARIEEGLAEIERLRLPANRATLTVSVTAAFASKWLLPRLCAFQERFPEIEVRIAAEDRFADFVSDGVDLGIRFWRGVYPGLSATMLMPDVVFPVCSPALLRSGTPLNAPEDLLHHVLLHDGAGEHDGSGCNWHHWFDSVGFKIEHLEGLRLSPGQLVLEAALNGLGVALGRATLVNGELSEGALVRPLEHGLTTTFSYYLVQRPKPEVPAHMAAFIGWLQDEATAWLARESECKARIVGANTSRRARRGAEGAVARDAGGHKKGHG